MGAALGRRGRAAEAREPARVSSYRSFRVPARRAREHPLAVRRAGAFDPDELLGAVVEGLLKALRGARRKGARQFFALASQHLHWELDEMARRLDEEPAPALLDEPAPASSGSGLTRDARRRLETIERLPKSEREAFELVWIRHD